MSIPTASTGAFVRDAERGLDVLRAWHDLVHDVPFQHCTEQPCNALLVFHDQHKTYGGARL